MALSRDRDHYCFHISDLLFETPLSAKRQASATIWGHCRA